jgi:hypothetical protein
VCGNKARPAQIILYCKIESLFRDDYSLFQPNFFPVKRDTEYAAKPVRGGAILGHGAAAFCGCVAE